MTTGRINQVTTFRVSDCSGTCMCRCDGRDARSSRSTGGWSTKHPVAESFLCHVEPSHNENARIRMCAFCIEVVPTVRVS
jgi:hypothetical protein